MGNPAIIWTFASCLAAASFARGVIMKAERSVFAEFGWYTIGAFCLVGAAILWVSLEKEIMWQHKVVLGTVGAVFGALACLTAGEFFHPSTAQAQSQPPNGGTNCIVNGNNNFNGRDGINCNTFNIGPQRLTFTEDIARQLIGKMPSKKPITLMSTGSNADQQVAGQYQAFLESNGYTVHRTSIGMMVPPPDHKITFSETPQEYQIVIAPSAQ